MSPLNRFEEAAMERADHAEQMRKAHLPDVPRTIADDVYSLAWEDGHANGWHEVEDAYTDLAAVVYRAFCAGKDAR